MTKKILVVAAHPDDEVLGVGGAIARHVEEGDAVAVLILGEGIASRTGTSKAEVTRLQKELRENAEAAAEALGAPKLLLRQLPDNAFDSVPLLSVVHEIEAAIKDAQPDLVYTHHGSDTNIDHRIVSQAVDAAVRPLGGSCIKEVLAFEVPSSTEWNFTRTPFRPNVFVALSEEQVQKKVAAMRAYVSEIREFPHPRSPEYLEALARVRGGQSGTMAAEAFELVYRRIS